MTEEFIIELAQRALLTLLLTAGPMLGLGLLVGLAVSLFQATTQIQEQTLTFIPKIIAVLGSIVIFGPWMLKTVLEFTNQLFINLHTFIY